MAMTKEFFEIACTIERHWEMAVLLDVGLEEPEWIPYSQINEDEHTVRQIPEGEHTTLEIALWLLEEKGIV